MLHDQTTEIVATLEASDASALADAVIRLMRGLAILHGDAPICNTKARTFDALESLLAKRVIGLPPIANC